MSRALPYQVAFILPAFAGGGAERVALTLASTLDERFRSHLIAFDSYGPLLDDVPPGTTVCALGRRRLRSAILPLISLLKAGDFDVVFSTIGYVNLALLAVRHLLPRKCRLVLREANLPQATIRHAPIPWMARLGYRRLYPTANQVICPSEQILRHLSLDFGVPTSRLIVLPNPIDVKRIRCAPAVRKHGEGRRFVAAGRLTYQKGWDRLVETFALADTQAHLTILGDGPDRQALQSQIDACGLTGRISLMGFVNEPWPYYRGADAFLMTSRWEGMPNAALEALAAGTPVIATPESGGLIELARETLPAAVTIAETGPAFRNAIAEVRPRTEAGDRPNLLPSRYELAEVARRFARILCPL